MLWPFVHNDVVQTKGYRQSLYFAVKNSVSRNRHIDVRSQSLIAVACMQIDKVASLVDYLGGERVGNALTDSAVGITGKHAIQIFTITGAVINRASQESGHISDVYQNYGAAYSCRI